MEEMHEYLPGDCRTRIHDLLVENGMTQAQLAEQIDLSEGGLSRYMSGETEKFSANNIIKAAKVFDVSTDFLLGLTNIPYRTNYDMEELGLSAKAAERLYTGEVDPVTVSQLIEHPEFALLVKQIAQFKDETIAAGIAGMNTMIDNFGKLLQNIGAKNPRWEQAAKCVKKDIEARKMPEGQTDTTAMEATFLRLVKDLRDGADMYIAQTQKLTTNAMKMLMKSLQKRGTRNRLKATPEQMVEAVLDTTDPRVITEQHKEALRVAMLPLFTKPTK